MHRVDTVQVHSKWHLLSMCWNARKLVRIWFDHYVSHSVTHLICIELIRSLIVACSSCEKLDQNKIVAFIFLLSVERDKTMSLFLDLEVKVGFTFRYQYRSQGCSSLSMGTGKKKREKYTSINKLKKIQFRIWGLEKMILASPFALTYEQMVP